MKIKNFNVIPSSYDLVSEVTEIVKDEDGNAIKDHGRPVTKTRYVKSQRHIFKPKFEVLYNGEKSWVYEADIVNIVGRKKCRKLVSPFKKQLVELVQGLL